jgi:hypothetical protein
MSANRIVHDDLYHPVPRRRKPELITALGADGTDPDPGGSEPAVG